MPIQVYSSVREGPPPPTLAPETLVDVSSLLDAEPESVTAAADDGDDDMVMDDDLPDLLDLAASDEEEDMTDDEAMMNLIVSFATLFPTPTADQVNSLADALTLEGDARQAFIDSLLDELSDEADTASEMQEVNELADDLVVLSVAGADTLTNILNNDGASVDVQRNLDDVAIEDDGEPDTTSRIQKHIQDVPFAVDGEPT